MTNPKRVYFGHPTSVFGTETQERCLLAISSRWSTCAIENPDCAKHEDGYRRYGMGYYLKQVLPLCDIGVFLAFEDGLFGAGVFEEAKWFEIAGRPRYEIFSDGRIDYLSLYRPRSLTIEETRARVHAAKKTGA